MRKGQLEIMLKKYVKLSYACFGTEFFITVSELGIVGASVALPIMIPFSAPVSVALTACLAILRSTNGLITKKVNKHCKIELLAKTKFNSIKKEFLKAMNDGEITDKEFNDIEQEIENYGNMKSNILNEYKVRTEVLDLTKTVKRINK